MKYAIRRAVFDSQEEEDLLNEGWEPFAALREDVEDPPDGVYSNRSYIHTETMVYFKKPAP